MVNARKLSLRLDNGAVLCSTEEGKAVLLSLQQAFTNGRLRELDSLRLQKLLLALHTNVPSAPPLRSLSSLKRQADAEVQPAVLPLACQPLRPTTLTNVLHSCLLSPRAPSSCCKMPIWAACEVALPIECVHHRARCFERHVVSSLSSFVLSTPGWRAWAPPRQAAAHGWSQWLRQDLRAARLCGHKFTSLPSLRDSLGDGFDVACEAGLGLKTGNTHRICGAGTKALLVAAGTAEGLTLLGRQGLQQAA